jgi:hypothetical protein
LRCMVIRQGGSLPPTSKFGIEEIIGVLQFAIGLLGRLLHGRPFL